MNKAKYVIMYAKWKIKGFSNYIITSGGIIYRLPYEGKGRYNNWHEVKGHECRGTIYYNLRKDSGDFTRLSRENINRLSYLHEKSYDTNILINKLLPF